MHIKCNFASKERTFLVLFALSLRTESMVPMWGEKGGGLVVDHKTYSTLHSPYCNTADLKAVCHPGFKGSSLSFKST